MGYFTKQIFNDPMSNYVDPNLGLLMQSSTALQQRHEKNRADMDAFDILASNVQVAGGDDAIKQAALAKVKQGIADISSKGAYALARPQLSLITKDFATDQSLNAAQDNWKAIQAHNERRAALAEKGQVFDFNPADNFSTLKDGKIQRFQSAVENKLDWDKAMQDVTKLEENQSVSGLSESNIRDYLQHGTVSGISEDRVKSYLDEAYKRYTNTAEGNQHERVLTQIYGADKDTARKRIMNDLFGVGKAQVHSKTGMDYMENRAETRRQAAEDKKKEAGEELVTPYGRLQIDASRTREDGAFGTTQTDNELTTNWLKTSIKDNNGSVLPGFMVDSPKIFDFADKLSDMDAKTVKEAPQYFQALHEFEQRRNQLKSQNQIGNIVSTSPFTAPSAAKNTRPVYDEKTKQDLAKIDEEEKAFKGKFNTEDVKRYSDYKAKIGSGKLELQNQLGKALGNLPMVANMSTTGKTNYKSIDGQPYAEMTGRITGAELKRAIGDPMFGESPVLKMMKKEGVINLSESEDLEDDKVYSINFSTKVNAGERERENHDRGVFGEKVTSENHDKFTRQYAEQQQYLKSFGQTVKAVKSNPKEAVTAAHTSIDNNPYLDAQQRAELKEHVSKLLANPDKLTQYQREHIADIILGK